jgi:hypothetical protein
MPFLTEAMISSGVHVAAEHIGVGHARHRLVGIAFAAAVAGRLHAHQPGVLAILHVADQLAVLDQHVAGRRRAFVVDGERAAPLGIVPSSTTVTPLAATCWPSRPAKAEVFLRLKSPSSPWPTASCSMTPGQPLDSTMSKVPAGAGHRLEIDQRWRSASSAACCQLSSARNSPKPCGRPCRRSRFPAGRHRRPRRRR